MKIGEESICYQHHQAEIILEKLLKRPVFNYTTHGKDLKEVIDWIHTANESAVRMEEKLKWCKENANSK